MTQQKGPSRLVDRENQGWYLTTEGYVHNWNEPALTLDELDKQRAPWRPVLSVTDEDVASLEAAFERAGRKTITTLAAAIEQVFHELREHELAGHHADAGPTSSDAFIGATYVSASESYDYAKRTLTAGRAGSWESAVLTEVMLFGQGLNLVRAKRGEDGSVKAMRERGPARRRVDVDARREMADVLRRWVTDPDRYTEVAATLAWVVSAYADRVAGADGWKAVADQWLQPGALARTDFVTCYRLLYSQSAHFDSGVL